MKLPAFAYFDPTTLEEALHLLSQYGGQAKVLAGGQSLLPLLAERRVRPAVVLDINRIAALGRLELSHLGVSLGATCRQRVLERHPDLALNSPLLAEAVPLIGYVQTRNRGTIGGSLAQAHPAAELPAVALTLGAEFTVERFGMQRRVSAEEFYPGLTRTTLAPDELLTAVTFPPWRQGTGWAIEKFSLRPGNYALVGIIVMLIASAYCCREARITVFGKSVLPQRLRQAESLLSEKIITPSLLDEVMTQVREETLAHENYHAPAVYQRHLAGTLAKRALQRAARRAALLGSS